MPCELFSRLLVLVPHGVTSPDQPVVVKRIGDRRPSLGYFSSSSASIDTASVARAEDIFSNLLADRWAIVALFWTPHVRQSVQPPTTGYIS